MTDIPNNANTGRTSASIKRTVVPAGELVKALGPLDATMIVMGSMIGSGIFIVPATIAAQVGSPALLLAVWIASGVMTLIGALSYGELAAMMPRAGGQYVYLRESLGPLWGFLYGWTMLLVIQTGTIAAVAIAFAKFFGVLVPWFSASAWLWRLGTLGPYHLGFVALGPYNVGLNTQNLLAIVSIVVITAINTFGLRIGALVQNVFTIAKTAALAALVLLGFWFSTAIARSSNAAMFWRNSGPWTLHPYPPDHSTWMISSVTVVGVAMVGALFSSDAWNNVTFTAGEVRKPSRTLPLSLGLGTLVVASLYFFANVAYLHVLPFAGDPHGATALARGMMYATDGRVGTAFAEVIFGPAGAILMAVAIIISTFGCNNGLILSGARIYYVMAKDGLFFRSAGTVNRHHAPGTALWVQCFWAGILCLSGTYSQLLNFLIFAVLIFYILTLTGLFVLRFKRPDAPRPYRAIGYPILPALYLLMAGFIEVQLLRYEPEYTWPGLMIVVLGVPVYGLWRLRGRNSTPAAGA
jgi:APA family basic amino acid/polyamine antiporter